LILEATITQGAGVMTERRQERNRFNQVGLRSRADAYWRLRGAALGAVLVLVVASGCHGKGGAEPVALTVGPREVPVDELERAFWNQQTTDQSVRPDSASLRRFIPVYADRVIWEELAKQAVPVLEGTPKSRIEDFEEGLIVEQLRRESYLDAAQPSAAELRKGYDDLGRELHVRYMVVGDRQEAEDLVLVLRQGGVFAKIASQKSLDDRSRDAGGDLGWITYYDISGEARERVWALKPGEIAGPLASNGQWQIFQVVEERPNVGRGTFEAEASRIRLGFLSTRGPAGLERFLDELLRKYEFKTDPVEIAWMTALLREKTASVPRDLGTYSPEDLYDPEVKSKFDRNPFQVPPVTPADTGRVLATFRGPGGRIRPYDIIDQLLTDMPLSWPKFEKSEDVVNLTREISIERLLVIEARARKIDQRPEIRVRVADKEREVRARFFYRTQIRPAASFTDSQVRDYYDSHSAEFHEGERRRFAALNTAESDLAREIQQQLQTGLKVSEVKARLIGRDPTLTGTGDKGTDLMTFGQSPALDGVLFALPKDGVSSPIQVGARWTVAKVLEIEPARTIPFDEAALIIRRRTDPARADSLLKVKIDEARPGFRVQVSEEALRKVRLKAPA
jgi:hypothetical protein